MNWTYETKQGDTWDVLSYDIYGSEKLAYVLLQANPQHMHMIFLPAGFTLTIPQLPKGKTVSPLPPWARR